MNEVIDLNFLFFKFILKVERILFNLLSNFLNNFGFPVQNCTLVPKIVPLFLERPLDFLDPLLDSNFLLAKCLQFLLPVLQLDSLFSESLLHFFDLLSDHWHFWSYLFEWFFLSFQSSLQLLYLLLQLGLDAGAFFKFLLQGLQPGLQVLVVFSLELLDLFRLAADVFFQSIDFLVFVLYSDFLVLLVLSHFPLQVTGLLGQWELH